MSEGRSRAARRVAGVLAFIGAVVVGVPGMGAVKWYVWDVVVADAGAADRSMVFWGIPVLFLGWAAVAAAVLLAWAGWRLLSSSRTTSDE